MVRADPDRNGHHDAAAVGGAISRDDVQVDAMKAERAMIAMTSSGRRKRDRLMTGFAVKRFQWVQA